MSPTRETTIYRRQRERYQSPPFYLFNVLYGQLLTFCLVNLWLFIWSTCGQRDELYIIITLSGIVAHFGGLKCILAHWNKPIKSDDQIIVRSKQPLKLEKPFQSLLTFTHSKKKHSSECFVVIFSVFIFSMPSKVIIIVIEFMFLGINIFWALLRAHFNPRLTARAKMSLSRAQNIFMLANINSIVLFARGSQQIRLAVTSAWTKSRPPVL